MEDTKLAEQEAQYVDNSVEPSDPEPETKPAPQVEAAPAEPELEPPETDAEPEVDERDKRMARYAHEARENKRLIRDMQTQLQAMKSGTPQQQQDADFERRVEEKAKEKAYQEQFSKLCNDVYAAGVKDFGKQDWDDALHTLSEQTQTAVPPAIVEAAADAGDPQKLIKYLADNPDEYEELLHMPIHRMGAKMAKLSVKLATPKPAPKAAVSKAPPPIKPIAGESKSELDLDNMPLEEYMAFMNKHDMQRNGIR